MYQSSATNVGFLLNEDSCSGNVNAKLVGALGKRAVGHCLQMSEEILTWILTLKLGGQRAYLVGGVVLGKCSWLDRE